LRGKRAHENLHVPSFVLQCFYMENGIIDYFGELYYKCFATKLEQRSEQEARLALKLLDSPRSILDVGCGWGRHLQYFLRWGLDAWGVEPNPLKNVILCGQIVSYITNCKISMCSSSFQLW